MKKNILFWVLCYFQIGIAQDISLLQQFNGHVDFTMIGNTLNPIENESASTCTILTTSSATLALATSDTIEAAYLYWAGSGTGDFQVKLNNQIIQAERVFESDYSSYSFFSAFTNVTNQIQTTGNGLYTFSELDLTSVIPDYCLNGTNFGGWAIVIIYSNSTLPINQINVYDGMQSVPSNITIYLENLNVIDNSGAKIGFLAWEGDSALAVNESLTINGDLIGNSLNPTNNAFNGTNSFTGETNLYNMDLDFYDIEDNIVIGDTSATIELTSGQDYVMVNCVITKLNSQLPDAIAAINNLELLDCVERTLSINFTISNTNLATGVLDENTPISVYANDVLIGTFYTQNEIQIGSSENFIEEIILPIYASNDIVITIAADDDGTGSGIVIEGIETNNEDVMQLQIPNAPLFTNPNNMISCNVGFERAVFDLTLLTPQISTNFNLEINYFVTEEAAIIDENEIVNIDSYTNTSNPQQLFIRITDPVLNCYSLTTVFLEVENCPITIPSGFSPNEDGSNDFFQINGLQDVYPYYELLIFNRYGNLVYHGNNISNPWNGKYKEKQLPSGTYFYTLDLNDAYLGSYRGWVYLMQ